MYVQNGYFGFKFLRLIVTITNRLQESSILKEACPGSVFGSELTYFGQWPVDFVTRSGSCNISDNFLGIFVIIS